eukprot:324091-Alexandrium_andersonii.AAC.1
MERAASDRTWPSRPCAWPSVRARPSAGISRFGSICRSSGCGTILNMMTTTTKITTTPTMTTTTVMTTAAVATTTTTTTT